MKAALVNQSEFCVRVLEALMTSVMTREDSPSMNDALKSLEAGEVDVVMADLASVSSQDMARLTAEPGAIVVVSRMTLELLAQQLGKPDFLPLMKNRQEAREAVDRAFNRMRARADSALALTEKR